MPKVIKNPVIWELEFRVEGNDVVIGSDAHYTVESEEVQERRACNIDVTSIETQLKQAAKNVVLTQIKAKEEIA